MPEEIPNPGEGIGKSRLESLSDGIFAFAMTLMVISLTVPEIPYNEAPALLPGIIAGMHAQFLIFIIAFFVISTYWLSHHQILRSVRFVNDRLIWINIVFLFFIVLIPFTTATSGDYPNVLEAVILFHVNILIASLMLTLLWWYISRHFDALNPGGKNPGGRGREKALVIPIVTLLAIGVSFFDTGGSMWCYMLIPIIMFILKHRSGAGKDAITP
jgi:uncharacterized membrane protein